MVVWANKKRRDQMRHLVYYCGNHPAEIFVSAINDLYDQLPDLAGESDPRAPRKKIANS